MNKGRNWKWICIGKFCYIRLGVIVSWKNKWTQFQAYRSFPPCSTTEWSTQSISVLYNAAQLSGMENSCNGISWCLTKLQTKHSHYFKVLAWEQRIQSVNFNADWRQHLLFSLHVSQSVSVSTPPPPPPPAATMASLCLWWLCMCLAIAQCLEEANVCMCVYIQTIL